MQRLSSEAKGPGKVYFTGGATALLFGIRDQTIDIDLKLDPEPPGAFEAIASLKNELDLNVEIASPDDFIPVPPDWQKRSILIEVIGKVSFYHFDLYAQALSKIERGHERDLADVKAMIEKKMVDPQEIQKQFAAIQSGIIRYPAIDAQAFAQKVHRFLDSSR